MQEFSYGADTPRSSRVRLHLRALVHLCPETQADIPNGIISRYPILEWGVWDDPETETREFVWARVDVPGPRISGR